MTDRSKEVWFRYRGSMPPFGFAWPVHWKGCALQIFTIGILRGLIDFSSAQIPVYLLWAAALAAIAILSFVAWRHSARDEAQ